MLYSVIACSNFSAVIIAFQHQCGESAAAVVVNVSTALRITAAVILLHPISRPLRGRALPRRHSYHLRVPPRPRIRPRYSSHQCQAWTTRRTSRQGIFLLVLRVAREREDLQYAGRIWKETFSQTPFCRDSKYVNVPSRRDRDIKNILRCQ